MYKDCWFRYKLCFNASGKKNYQQNRSSNLHKYQLASTHTSVIPGVINWTYNSSSNYRQAIIPLRAAHKRQPSPQHFSFPFQMSYKDLNSQEPNDALLERKNYFKICCILQGCVIPPTPSIDCFTSFYFYIFINNYLLYCLIEVRIFAANFSVFKLTQESC